MDILGINFSIYEIAVIAAMVVMSIVGFAIMGADKARAKARKWRIKEATLFAVAFLMGGIGSTLGMLKFRHKTDHWYFAVGFPFLALFNVAVAVAIFILT